ncbi:MAG: fluoride efflux transporter CrcB [Pseudohongiellaceae bacterium]|jgi:CrcB protein
MYMTLAIALGGALGAVGRYWLTVAANQLNSSSFPLGTFLVNVLGSFLIGACFILFLEKLHLVDTWRPLLMTGFLGAFTTFSTYSLDTLLLFQQGLYNTAFLYLFSSVLVCLGAAYAGMQLTRVLL